MTLLYSSRRFVHTAHHLSVRASLGNVAQLGVPSALFEYTAGFNVKICSCHIGYTRREAKTETVSTHGQGKECVSPSLTHELPEYQYACILLFYPTMPRQNKFIDVSCRSGVKVNALDAAMPFDFESRAADKMKAERSLKIGIVGFGTFGQFLARRIAQQGHKVGSVIIFIHLPHTFARFFSGSSRTCTELRTPTCRYLQCLGQTILQKHRSWECSSSGAMTILQSSILMSSS